MKIYSRHFNKSRKIRTILLGKHNPFRRPTTTAFAVIQFRRSPKLRSAGKRNRACADYRAATAEAEFYSAIPSSGGDFGHYIPKKDSVYPYKYNIFNRQKQLRTARSSARRRRAARNMDLSRAAEERGRLIFLIKLSVTLFTIRIV